jgi:23S rRNA (adenine2030-N6)-methyltransferase
MNYRHAYHAGNHADVLKHVVLARLIEHLKKKDKGFLFLDAHAGTGVYDLQGLEAFKTGEWQGGIGKMAAPFSAGVEALIAPYRRAIAKLNDAGGIKHYPGSPELAARLMRVQDRLVLNELHPQDFAAAERRYASDSRVRLTAGDAEVAIKAYLPPAERRGLILIDPPYEEKDEAARAIAMLEQGLRRFATGVFALWYPIKADMTDAHILRGVKGLGVAGTLRVELRVREAFAAGGLAGSGLAIVNTPWKLDDELRQIVPALAQRLGLGKWGQATVEWLLPPA